MDHRDGYVDYAKVFSEDELKRMSRHVRDIIPETAASEDVINKLTSIFESVLVTAASPGLSAIHRVAAWNTLCALIDRRVSSSDETARDVLWSGNVWSRAFDIYLSQSHLARPKSSRQLLATLTGALHKDARIDGAIQSKSKIVFSLMDGLMLNDDPGRAKACALALGQLLSKDVLALSMMLEACHSPHQEAIRPAPQRQLEHLLFVLFTWMSKGDFGSTIAQVVSAILDRSQQADHTTEGTSGSSDDTTWMIALRRAVRVNGIEVADLRVHLLPTLFKRTTTDYLNFLRSLGLAQLSDGYCHPKIPETAHTEEELLYASLQAGKDLGLLIETDGHACELLNGTVYVPIRWIGGLLIRDSRTARLTGFSVLISSNTATRPFLRKALRLIKRNLSHFFADTDSNFRSEVSGSVQRLIDRMRAITAVLARHIDRVRLTTSDNDTQAEETLETLQYHKAFLEWFRQLIFWELRPTASYQRHISALKCLSIFVRSGLDAEVHTSRLSKSALGATSWPFRMRLMASGMRRVLLDLVLDAFDDVRQMASGILTLYRTEEDTNSQQNRLALSRAEEAMLASGRADQADGVAHLYTLLYEQAGVTEVATTASVWAGQTIISELIGRLELMLRTAKADLSQAVKQYPLHGLLTSIRYILILQQTEKAELVVPLERLAACLHDLWDVVKPTLCNDAPEGYLPEGMEEAAAVSTKDTLSYCWRALKEASLLLGSLLTLPLQPGGDDHTIRTQKVEELCDLCFTQLAELRHRGAFSTVAQTWIVCCTQSFAFATSGDSVLRYWYNQVLLILRNKTTINTRRSAGLPSLICGILVAEKSGTLMQQAFSDLEAIARESVDPAFAQEGSLPQVHAMNCMKDILKNSRLGEQSERHVPAALKLAAGALRSEAWAVRNCGLMLFRAVIDRLLGTSDAYLEDDVYVQKKLSAEQHPQLLDIVLELLEGPTSKDGTTSTTRHEGVFPALQLLQRLSLPEDQRPRALQSVETLMESPVWHVRDKAARTYASLVTMGQYAEKLAMLLRKSSLGQNALHGALLCAKYMIRVLVGSVPSAASQPEKTNIDESLWACSTAVFGATGLYYSNLCPITRAAYLDLCSECLLVAHESESTASTDSQDEHYSRLEKANASFDLEIIWRELRQSLSAENLGQTAQKVPRPALTALFAAQLMRTTTPEKVQSQNVSQTAVDLAVHDPDTCIILFSRLSFLMSAPKKTERINNVGTLINACAAVIILPSITVDVRVQAMETLFNVIDRLQLTTKDSRPLLDFATEDRTPVQPVLSSSSQRHADLWLQFRAACANLQIQHDDGALSRSLVPGLEAFASSCCSAVTGTGFCSPEAAALLVGRVNALWSALAARLEMSDVFLHLCLVVYDLLNDDDEDIRVLASRAACGILATDKPRNGNSDLVPVVASQRLIDFMMRRWRDNDALVREAFVRAFSISGEAEVSVTGRLNVSEHIETALFMEEKQNLYIDEAREVRAWSQVLIRLPSQSMPPSLLKRLGHWVTDGLAVLTQKMSAVADGPLGWTTKPELFVLGLQVVYGAEMLLRYVERGAKTSVRPSSLRKQLADLSAGGGDDGINGLWQSEIDRVLSQSVNHKLCKVHALLESLHK